MHSENYDRALDRAAEFCGVEPEFWDIFGNRHVASRATKQAFVSALGISTASEEELAAGVSRVEHAEWTQVADPCRVVSVNQQPLRFPIQVPAELENASAEVHVLLEDGKTARLVAPLAASPVIAASDVGGRRYLRKEITLSEPFPLGYHSLRISVEGIPAATTRLIVAPDRAYLPRFLEEGAARPG